MTLARLVEQVLCCPEYMGILADTALHNRPPETGKMAEAAPSRRGQGSHFRYAA